MPPQPKPGRLLAAAALGILLLGGSPPSGGIDWLGARPAAAQATASIEGFRSARFGMTESEVRKALMKDFGVGEDDIGRAANAIEKTTSLIIDVEDIIPDSGIAAVGYIFGYKRKKLIQVNIVWGAENKASTTPENLVATGNILRSYFVEQGFPKEGMIVNERLADGSVVMFRGIDAKGRVAVLQLTVVPAAGDEGTPPTQDVSLRLSYIVDPDNPDIFKIDKGAF